MDQSRKVNIAVIDFGTNTFNLTIAGIDCDKKRPVFTEEYKIPVKLGSGTYKTSLISQNAIKRAVETAEFFRNLIKENNIDIVLAFGTAALRDAKNGLKLKSILENILEIPINIIDGHEEARIIYKGAWNCRPVNLNLLVMDIGGGSVEIIIGRHQTILQKASLPAGVAKIYDIFNWKDPVTPHLVNQLQVHFEKLLTSNFHKTPIDLMYGSAGSFETLANIFYHQTHHSDMPDDMNYYQLSKQDMLDFFEKIKFSTLEERLAIPGMHPMRAEWMVIALIEIIKTIEYFSVNDIWYVSHSLKEGAVYDWIDQHC
jgi:exopolyphosphatase/guanosine-5'-triphosphate,3'-diphosphate pyrophosphatase